MRAAQQPTVKRALPICIAPQVNSLLALPRSLPRICYVRAAHRRPLNLARAAAVEQEPIDVAAEPAALAAADQPAQPLFLLTTDPPGTPLEHPNATAIYLKTPIYAPATGTLVGYDLALAQLMHMDLTGKTVLCWRSGLAILGVAALLRGAKNVLAGETSVQAWNEAVSNAELNGFKSDKFQLVPILPHVPKDDFESPAPTAPWSDELKLRKFDVCMVNMDEEEGLLEAHSILADHVAPGGTIIATGFYQGTYTESALVQELQAIRDGRPTFDIVIEPSWHPDPEDNTPQQAVVSQWNEGDPDLVPGMLVARASAQLRPPRFAPQPPTPTGEPATLAPPSEYLQRQEGLPADFSASKASDRVVDDETEDQAESASGGSAESAPVGGTQGSWTDLWREAWQMDTRPQRAQEIFDELLAVAKHVDKSLREQLVLLSASTQSDMCLAIRMPYSGNKAQRADRLAKWIEAQPPPAAASPASSPAGAQHPQAAPVSSLDQQEQQEAVEAEAQAIAEADSEETLRLERLVSEAQSAGGGGTVGARAQEAIRGLDDAEAVLQASAVQPAAAESEPEIDDSASDSAAEAAKELKLTLESKTVAELKDICAANGLTKGGNKTQLINKLLDAN